LKPAIIFLLIKYRDLESDIHTLNISITGEIRGAHGAANPKFEFYFNHQITTVQSHIY